MITWSVITWSVITMLPSQHLTSLLSSEARGDVCLCCRDDFVLRGIYRRILLPTALLQHRITWSTTDYIVIYMQDHMFTQGSHDHTGNCLNIKLLWSGYYMIWTIAVLYIWHEDHMTTRNTLLCSLSVYSVFESVALACYWVLYDRLIIYKLACVCLCCVCVHTCACIVCRFVYVCACAHACV